MSRRVLFCDDDPDIRAVTELALGLDHTLETRCCEAARDVLAVAARWQPDLILLDVMMPGMDGPTVLAHLQANPCTRTIPVVFMTARTQNYECQHFRSLGAAGVLAKPFDPMTLASVVRGYFSPDQLPAGAPEAFQRYLKDSAATLIRHRERLEQEKNPAAAIGEIGKIAVAISAGCHPCNICGACRYSTVSAAAATLKDATASFRPEEPLYDSVLSAVDGLKAAIDLETPRAELVTAPVLCGAANAGSTG